MIVLDEMAEFLVDGFQALDGLHRGLDAEKQLDADTPECRARQQQFESQIAQRSQQIDAVIEALRDVHVELTMRENQSLADYSSKLRDLFLRVRAENEVNAELAATAHEEDAQRLPREELSSSPSPTAKNVGTQTADQ